MAIKTQTTAAPAAPAPAPQDTMVLELDLYSNYNRGGVAYVKGKQYRFSRENALTLLSEQDLGRPVWKIFRVKPVQKAEEKVVDYTEAVIAPVLEPIVGSEVPNKIEIGDDSELADLNLNAPENVLI